MAEKLDGHFDELKAPANSECHEGVVKQLQAECYSYGTETLSTDQTMISNAALFAHGLEQRLSNGFGQVDLANSVKDLSSEDIPRMAALMNQALREEGLADKLFVTGSSDGEISLSSRNVTHKRFEAAKTSFYEPGEGLSFSEKALDKEAVKTPSFDFARSLGSSRDELGDEVALKQLVAAFKAQGADPMDLPSTVNTVLRAENLPFYLQANSDGEIKLFRTESSVSYEKLASEKVESTD